VIAFKDSRNPYLVSQSVMNLPSHAVMPAARINAEANEHPMEGQITPAYEQINESEWK